MLAMPRPFLGLFIGSGDIVRYSKALAPSPLEARVSVSLRGAPSEKS